MNAPLRRALAAMLREVEQHGLDLSPQARMARADILFPERGWRGMRIPGSYSADDIQSRPWQWYAEGDGGPETANSYATNMGNREGQSGVVVPARYRFDNPLELDVEGAHFNSVPFDLLPADLRRAMNAQVERYGATTNRIAGAAEALGYDGVRFRNIRDTLRVNENTPISTVSIVFPAANQRSIFAQFDPRRIKDRDLMAAIPLLAALRELMNEERA